MKEWSQYGQRVFIFWKFLQFSSYNYDNFLSKISVTKFQKSKIWDDCYKGISAGFIPVDFIFSVDTVFMENFAKLLWKIQKQGLFGSEFEFTPPPSQGASPIQEDRFEPTNFNWGPRISFISILTCHEKVNHLKQLVIRFVQKLTV